MLKHNGKKSRARKKTSEGADEILQTLRKGHTTYVINSLTVGSQGTTRDRFLIRHYAVEKNVTMFSSLDTVTVLLDVLEEITVGVSTIDA